MEQYVARDRARVAEIRAQREVSTEPVLLDRSVGIEDASARAAIQAEDQAQPAAWPLVEAMNALSPIEATEAFLAWEQSAERKAMLPVAGAEVSQSLPVLEEWVAGGGRLSGREGTCRRAQSAERADFELHGILRKPFAGGHKPRRSCFSINKSEPIAETIRQSRNPIIESTNETHD